MNTRKTNITLTKRESQAMDILWNTDHPLTINDIMEQLADWKEGYIYLVMSSLDKKGMVQTVGLDRTSTRKYSRTFSPAITREEYAAKLALSLGFEKNSIPGIALAMAKEAGNNKMENTISELEEIIRELKAQQRRVEQ